VTSLERAFDDSLRRMAAGENTRAECLDRYPEHAEQLAVLLDTADSLERMPGRRLSETGRLRGRNRLLAHMRTHPRTRPARHRVRRFFTMRRWAPALAAVALALTTGTVAAQSASPGEWLYPWRQASESVWVRVSPNHHAAALSVSNRRLEDLLDSQPGTSTYQQSFTSYENWIRMMENASLVDATTEPTLERQRMQLQSAGIDSPEIDRALRRGASGEQAAPTLNPAATPTDRLEPTPSAPSTLTQQEGTRSGPQGPGASTQAPGPGKRGPNQP
jgi:hypothetical protein